MPSAQFVPVTQLFELQAAKHPGCVAASYAGTRVTYAELEIRANRLAHYLKKRGVGPDVCVAIAIDRSIQMVQAVLAVLKAGGAYVPLDPTYPAERLAFMLEDAGAPVLLSTQALAAVIPCGNAQVILVDANANEVAEEPSTPPAMEATSQNLAYLIYTSGSTGKPKGVAMHREPLENLIQWQVATSPAKVGDKTLQFAPLSFDVHFQEIFSTWATGGELVLVDDELRLDAARLLKLIESEGVSRLFLPFVALQNLADVAVAKNSFPSSLTEVVTAGEQLVVTKSVIRFFEALPECRFHNHYGPSETHVATAFPLEGSPTSWSPLPPIGKAIDNALVRLLDAHMQPVEAGEEGELYLGGTCVARGYLNRPELTASRFLPDPFGPPGARLYKTGDLACQLPDGNYEFRGRVDNQVKVRGFRIELGEVELALDAHACVQQAVVVVREDEPGDKRLVAYLVVQDAPSDITEQLRKHLGALLPDYMVPSTFVVVDDFPRTPSGKIDRRGLPAPTRQRPVLTTAYAAPESELEHAIAEVWQNLVKIDRIGIDDNFFDLGGTSLLALQCVVRLGQRLLKEVSVVQLFAHPTVRALAQRLGDAQAKGASRARTRRHADRSEGVAIIGMSGRFPGAETVRELWNLLREGRDATSLWSAAELDPTLPRDLVDDPAYVRRRGIVTDADCFDASFFSVTPREAEVMDPQQRLLLEAAWAALESAGYPPASINASVGVFAGTHNNSYYLTNILPRPDVVRRAGAFSTMASNEKDYVATRIAHKLNLHGPALSIHTACSTSLVAIVVAVENLLAGTCDMALAGGSAITVPQRNGHLYQEGGMLSKDGYTRPFDAAATGTVFSDGAGMIVLKRLEDAVRDRDNVLAVIRGAALNNDGADKASFTAPSVDGQASVIASAQAMAGIDVRAISYVEAHGTATPLGDPIEVEALTLAFRERTDARQFCGLGSIKSNVGHLTAAAGVAGLIKTALALKHELLPPTVHYRRPNPQIDFTNSPFYVVGEPTPWPRQGDRPRYAGVSSFGVGGTNAHVVVEEAPVLAPSGPSLPYQLLLLSAKTRPGLQTITDELAEHLRQEPKQNLADVAYTLHVGREGHAERRFVVARGCDDAVKTLTSLDARFAATGVTNRRNPPVVFLFPGQGAQYVGMGANLYRDEPQFRLIVDQCAEVLTPHIGRDLRKVLYPDDPNDNQAQETLKRTEFTQAALFVVEYALAKLWMSWGVNPALMAGHSVGEFVCAVLAGVMRLEDALALVAARGKLIQGLPAGTMLSVRLAADLVEPRLPASVSIAASNSPNLCVVSGPSEDVAEVSRRLEAEGIVCKPLHTSHAFHSPMMDPAVEPFRRLVAEVPLSPPQRPFISTVTSQPITAELCTDPTYWARHLRQPVRFAEAIATIWTDPDRVLLEVGPGTTLATLARQQKGRSPKQVAISSLARSADEDAEWLALLSAVGQLWLAGAAVVPHQFFAHEERRRLDLPTYPFERKRYWVDAPFVTTDAPAATAAAPAATPQHPGALPSNGAQSMSKSVSDTALARKASVIRALQKVIEDASGLELNGTSPDTTFLELGLDSLLLTQVTFALKKEFAISIGFRQLLEDLPNLDLLAEYLLKEVPQLVPDAPPAPLDPLPTAVSAPPVASGQPAEVPAAFVAAIHRISATNPDSIQGVVQQQLLLMQQQLLLLGLAPAGAAPEFGTTAAPQEAVALLSATPVATRAPTTSATARSDEANDTPVSAKAPAHYLEGDEPPRSVRYDTKKAFGASASTHTTDAQELSTRQREKLDALIQRYNAKTKGSKAWTEQHRDALSDPRIVTGFRPLIKELIYPIVAVRSSGARLWDIDGNEYIDALNGFGSNFLGHASKVVSDAMKQQIDAGYEIGPMQPSVGACADLVCELTGADRAAFCNTGSEAVMGALRIARAVTGRQRVAMFSGSYHGIFDEVLVRGTRRFQPIPAASGIMPESVTNALVVEYGTPESMEILKAQAGDLAAVLVEPVQSRRPDFRPVEFLRELRQVTERGGCAYIWDEVITGFRIEPGGAQAHFGIKADLATYGTVLGGGMPMGVIAGKREWMDALDGGSWTFGDDSVPTVGATYFAGTFVRHPLSMAATRATLEHLKQRGPELQRGINARTERLAETLNTYFQRVGAPVKIKYFASLWKIFQLEDHPQQDLLFCFLREKGIHIWDGFPCFLTDAHTDADVDQIINAFKGSIEEMQSAGFYPESTRDTTPSSFNATQPPVPGARLGRDEHGNPAWFVPNPNQSGKYMKVEMQ